MSRGLEAGEDVDDVARGLDPTAGKLGAQFGQAHVVEEDVVAAQRLRGEDRHVEVAGRAERPRVIRARQETGGRHHGPVKRVLHRRGGHVATVCYDNVAKLNAIDGAGADALSAAIRQAGESPEVRVIVLRGAGERAFIGGADIRAMADLTPETARPFVTALHGVRTALRDAPVPAVARVSGYCLGAGVGIAASCDLRVADTTARFAVPEVVVGIPSVIASVVLPRLVGWGRAARVVYTGETFGAEQAYDWGLVEASSPKAKSTTPLRARWT